MCLCGLHYCLISLCLQQQFKIQIRHLQIINPLNAELNPLYHFLALSGAHPILHVSGVRVKEKYGGKQCSETVVVHSIYETYPAACTLLRSFVSYVTQHSTSHFTLNSFQLTKWNRNPTQQQQTLFHLYHITQHQHVFMMVLAPSVIFLWSSIIGNILLIPSVLLFKSRTVWALF